MTGAYIRIERDGKWQAVEVEHLTLAERREAFKNKSHNELVNWLDMLCAKVRECEEIIFDDHHS
jgi:hypothetical protein